MEKLLHNYIEMNTKEKLNNQIMLQKLLIFPLFLGHICKAI